MLSPAELYPLVQGWIQHLVGPSHALAQAALAQLVTALLVGQSLRPTALMRALLSPRPVPARQRYKRVARVLDRPWLSSARLTPLLVRAAVALVDPDPADAPTAGLTHLALDSLRCGRWEILIVGVVWHGRVLPVGWRVLPYPWPRKQFTPTACALIQAVAAHWPATRPVHLVADRAFPSRPLLQTLHRVGWGWTLRLRATHTVTVAGRFQPVRALLASARLGSWQQYPTSQYGRGAPAIVGLLVVGRGLLVVPWHQRTSGSVRHRVKQHAQRQQHLRDKLPRRYRDTARTTTEAWVVLFSSHLRRDGALASYRRRWSIEGSYRDVQGGWDGQHGWDLEPVVQRTRTATRVEHLVGLWALGAVIQSWVGHQAEQATAPPQVQAVVQQWTTTGRLSVWARGRLALTDPTGHLREWLPQTLQDGAQRIGSAAPPMPPRSDATAQQDPLPCQAA